MSRAGTARLSRTECLALAKKRHAYGNRGQRAPLDAFLVWLCLLRWAGMPV